MRIGVLVFPGVQMLDVVGPVDVFTEGARQARQPGIYQIELISTEPGSVRPSNGLAFHADSTLDTCSSDIDTLVVAGSPNITTLQHDPQVLAWLQAQAPKVRRLTSVCTGAFLLAQAGLLDGRRATTHWNSTCRLARSFPTVKVEGDPIYVRDGAIYTSAGGSAGMDLALALVEEDLGREVALKVARELVMFLKRPGGQAQFSAHLAAQTAERSVIRDVQTWVLEHLDQPLSVDELASRAGMSTRNFSRQFKQDTDMTPAEFVESARIDSARRMLEETANPLKRIAAWSGFADQNGLRRAFMRRMGVSPTDYRSRFQKPALN
jgi:transcriptional regulator GlxA family with amidase domain